MQDSEIQSDSVEPVPSFNEVVEAKKVLLRNRLYSQPLPARYPVHLGLVPVRQARRFLLMASMLCIVAMGLTAILGIWEAIRLVIVGRIVMTCIITFATLGFVVAANFYLGPVKWMTLEEQQDHEAAC